VVADAAERIADIDDRLDMITVTAVDTSPDLSHATVYLSSLSDDARDALEAQRVELQRAIGRQVRLKRTPLLHFAADPSVAHGQRVEDILRQLHAERPDDGPDDGPDDRHGGDGPGGAPR
jgi:ribosome-binding factor A